MNRLSRAILASLVLTGIKWPGGASAQSLLDEATTASASDAANIAVGEVVQQDSLLVRQFESSIANIESDLGPFAANLPEQLLGLGLALQQQGQHLRAVDVLKRGVHVMRINGGLYSVEQIPLLRSQIKSLRALGEFDTVDERQRYLYRVERRALGTGIASVNALMRQANWHREAYELALDPTEIAPQRLLYMWDLYRLALNQLIDIYGMKTPELLPALEGMLTSQYLIMGYRNFDTGVLPKDNDLRLAAYTSEAYKRGKSVLRAIMEIHAAHNENDPMVRAQDLQRLGDWAWLFGDRFEAMQPYEEAWAVALTLDDSGATAAELFAKPELIPTIASINPLPTPTEGDGGPLVLSFNVTDKGRVRGLERLRGPDVKGRDPTARLVKQVKRARFRPRIVDGEPVPTEGMVWSFNEEDWLALQ